MDFRGVAPQPWRGASCLCISVPVQAGGDGEHPADFSHHFVLLISHAQKSAWPPVSAREEMSVPVRVMALWRGRQDCPQS